MRINRSMPAPVRTKIIRSLIFCLIAAFLFLSACRHSGSEMGGKPAENGEPQKIAVTTSRAVARQVPSFIYATGSFAADETSDVAPEISGQVIETPIDA